MSTSFTPPAVEIDGTTAEADSVNNLSTAVEAAFVAIEAVAATAATEGAAGVVELATNAEAVTGTASDNKAIVPSSLTARLEAPGAIGGTTPAAITATTTTVNTAFAGTAFLDENDMASNSATKAVSQQSIKAYVDNHSGIYDIIIGSAAQVTSGVATNVISELNDGLTSASDKILILDGTHTLTGNLALSDTDLTVHSESSSANLNLSTFTATFSGNLALVCLRATNAGAGDIIVSGTGSIFNGINVSIASVTVSNGAIATTSGASGGVKNSEFIGDLTGTADTASALVGTCAPTTMTASAWPSFNVTIGTQANITGLDKVDWSVENFDSNSDFATGTFTPTAAGTYLLTANIGWSSAVAGDEVLLHIYKNGVSEQMVRRILTGATETQNTSLVIDANGTTDYFDVYAQNTDRDTADLVGGNTSQFSGSRIA